MLSAGAVLGNLPSTHYRVFNNVINIFWYLLLYTANQRWLVGSLHHNCLHRGKQLFLLENRMQSVSQAPSRSISAFLAKFFHHDRTLGYIFLAPAFLYLALLMAYPFAYAVFLSFSDKQIGSDPNFIGLANYAKLWGTSLYSKTITNSLIYTVVTLILKCLGGLALASLLNREFFGQRILKALLLLPWIMPTVFSTMIWSWILHPGFSIINEILMVKLGVIREPLPFLRDEVWAMGSLIFINVWRGVPFFGITFLAAIQSVPTEILEASRIDGASRWTSFWRITFPMIIPVVIIVALISTIGTIGDFDLPFLLTNGGPNNATTLFALTTYTLSFKSGMIGLGSAVTMTMFPFLIILVVASLYSIRRQQQG
jgi:multiple sugar transport system permease protein